MIIDPPLQVCGVGCLKKPRATESIFGEIRMKKRLRAAPGFSGYRSKKRLGELASLCLFFFFITLHVKDNRRERKKNRWVSQTNKTGGWCVHLLFLALNVLFHICISHIQQNSFLSILSFSAVLGRTAATVYACTWCSVVLRGMPLASQRQCLSTAASSLLFSIQRDSRLISAPWTAANTLLLWQLEPADSCLEVRSVSSQ